MPNSRERRITVGDNVSLHVRQYGTPGTPPGASPILCLPGLTRNERDFSGVAPRLAALGRQVFAVSLRGRGQSSYAQAAKDYHPLVYRDDIIALLNGLEVERAIFIGTSLGGLVSMLTHHHAPDRVAAVVLNDIGPELAPGGLQRIVAYVSAAAQNRAPVALPEATARVKAINAAAFPDAGDDFWDAFAQRTHRKDHDGWRLDYDQTIAHALFEAGPAPDYWAPFNGLAEIPTLLIHGGVSDLLTDVEVETMRLAVPSMRYCNVPNVGHAPMLDEPAALAALRAFISGLVL